MLSVHLPTALEDRLTETAKAIGQPPDECIIQAVSNYLDEIDDLRQAEEALLEIREGRAQTFTLQEVMRDYGLDD